MIKVYGDAVTKKMLNILILQILKDFSDDDHHLTQQEIIRKLRAEYGVEKVDRRTVRDNVQSLVDMGYDIENEGEDGYYMTMREFDDAELRMLIDSVLFSKSLTQKQSKALVDKLCAMGNKYFSAKVSHIYNLPELHREDNKQLMYAIDAVNDAISEKKKISFVYNSYGTDLKQHPKREEPYIVNPYQIVASNGFYYLIGNYDVYDNVSHYRLDKMTDVRILEEKVKPKSKVKDFANGYSLPKHMAEHIYMFGGESVRVKFLIDEDMINALVDWFGKDFRICSVKDGKVTVSVNCNENAMFYWALQYGPYVEVLEPPSLRGRLMEEISTMNNKYNYL